MSRPKIAQYKPGAAYRYAHLKRDGIWLELCGGTSAGPTAGCWTRHPSNLYPELSEHPTVREFFRRAADKEYARLYCELYAPGHPQSEVKSLLAQGKMGRLVIECFATPMLDARAGLHEAAEVSVKLGVPFNEAYWSYEPDPNMSVHEFLDECYRLSAQADSEGLVYKDGNLLNWAKRKAEPTADLVILGYTEGKGKYEGQIGAIECGLYKPERVSGCEHEYEDEYQHVCNVSGMDDATRRLLTEQDSDFLFKVVEVKYQYVGANGGLRHPRFVRFRDDKRPEECTEI